MTATSATVPYWPYDELALAVWGAVGARTVEIDEEPEAAIERMRASGYTADQACEELGINPATRREIAIAAAWAGVTRVATARRDAAVRWCWRAGSPKRELGRAIGAAGNGVKAIDRILERP